MKRLLFLLCLSFAAQGADHPPLFEGFFGKPTASISNLTQNVWYFLPYNPVIVEVGGFEGEHTIQAAQRYPHGRIFVFEPNPNAFSTLLANIQPYSNATAIPSALHSTLTTATLHLNHGVYCNDPRLEKYSSLLESFCLGTDHFNCFRGPTLEVPCISLDEWCQENQIDHIDFLHLDTEGFELQILQGAIHILPTILVIHAKTNHAPFRKGTTQYRDLRAFLEQHGFTLFSHWYLEGLQGEATFIQKRIFDVIFN
jgi:FkbM family methyltransferase